MRLEGGVALVTGGSRGLGEATARTLAARGARVVLSGRDRPALDAAVARIRAAGGEAHGIAADLAEPEAAWRLAAAAAAAAGPIDVLVHNASTLGPLPLRPLLDTDDDDFRQAFEVNVGAPFRLTRAIAGGMVVRGAGVIVHVSSDAAVEAYPQWGAYGASKAALDHLARTWAVELEGTGVRVVTVDPGEMDTRMHAEAMPDADRSRLASPDDVAAALVSLLAEVETVPSGARIGLAAWRAERFTPVAR
jgi:NAD(P)-dependent dehydrogenase (short-subunit alcohol dehydrogenase family)